MKRADSDGADGTAGDGGNRKASRARGKGDALRFDRGIDQAHQTDGDWEAVRIRGQERDVRMPLRSVL